MMKTAQAGTLESMDCVVSLTEGDGHAVSAKPWKQGYVRR